MAVFHRVVVDIERLNKVDTIDIGFSFVRATAIFYDVEDLMLLTLSLNR